MIDARSFRISSLSLYIESNSSFVKYLDLLSSRNQYRDSLHSFRAIYILALKSSLLIPYSAQVSRIIHFVPDVRIFPEWHQYHLSFPTAISANHGRAKHQEVIICKQGSKYKPLYPVPFYHQHPHHNCDRKNDKREKNIPHRNPRIHPFEYRIHKKNSSR